MSERRATDQRIEAAIESAIDTAIDSGVKIIKANPSDPEALRFAASEVIGASGGNVPMIVPHVMSRVALAEEKFEKVIAHIKDGQRLSWVLGPPVEVGVNGTTKRVIYGSPLGTDLSVVQCVTIPDDVEDIDIPPPLSLVYVDATARLYLGRAEWPAVMRSERHTVKSVNPAERSSGVGVLSADEVPGAHQDLFANAEHTREITRRLEEGGGKVAVRSADRIVVEVVNGEATTATPEWMRLLDAEGPGLDSLVFPEWLRREWRNFLDDAAKGRAVYLALLGPTGTGKTTSPERFGHDLARLTGKPVWLLEMALHSVGSIYYTGTSQEMSRRFDAARKIVADGGIPIILVDEADSLCGSAAGRYEGSANRDTRNAFQSLTSEPIQGVVCCLTMNLGSERFLSPEIAGRFDPIVYPAPTRRIMAQVAALNVTPRSLARLDNMTARVFGKAVAHFLYGESLRVARAVMRSGQVRDVLARDMRVLNPRTMKQMVDRLNRNAERDNGEVSLDTFRDDAERVLRFHAAQLCPDNLFDNQTFLPQPPHDRVETVEPLTASGASFRR